MRSVCCCCWLLTEQGGFGCDAATGTDTVQIQSMAAQRWEMTLCCGTSLEYGRGGEKNRNWKVKLTNPRNITLLNKVVQKLWNFGDIQWSFAGNFLFCNRRNYIHWKIDMSICFDLKNHECTDRPKYCLGTLPVSSSACRYEKEKFIFCDAKSCHFASSRNAKFRFA